MKTLKLFLVTISITEMGETSGDILYIVYFLFIHLTKFNIDILKIP